VARIGLLARIALDEGYNATETVKAALTEYAKLESPTDVIGKQAGSGASVMIQTLRQASEWCEAAPDRHGRPPLTGNLGLTIVRRHERPAPHSRHLPDDYSLARNAGCGRLFSFSSNETPGQRTEVLSWT
jgi:hypothetical protein